MNQLSPIIIAQPASQIEQLKRRAGGLASERYPGTIPSVMPVRMAGSKKGKAAWVGGKSG